MKIQGIFMDILVEIALEVYQDYIIDKNSKKVLYLVMKKALYGMLQSALLFFKEFRVDIESIGFKVNPYDPCVATD
jgi:hypothetical protein